MLEDCRILSTAFLAFLIPSSIILASSWLTGDFFICFTVEKVSIVPIAPSAVPRTKNMIYPRKLLFDEEVSETFFDLEESLPETDASFAEEAISSEETGTSSLPAAFSSSG